MAADVAYLPTNPRILAWARKRCSASVEEAAKHLGVTAERVQDWEDGSRQPTVKQARKLADYYDVPFLEFFSKSVPPLSRPAIIPDFRSLRADQSGRDRFALMEVQSWAEEHRLNALDLIDLLGDTPPQFPEGLYATTSDDAETIAAKARATIGPRIEDQLSLKPVQRDQFPQILRTHLDRAGVLVLRQSGIHDLGVRGICIYGAPLPVIVYGKESPGAQAFTIAHELGHITLRESGISGYPRMGARRGARLTETWCNHFASAFLMPKDSVVADMKGSQTGAVGISDDNLRLMADRYSVSRHAMLIRLVTLGYVKPAFYWFVKRPQFLAEEEKKFKSYGRAKYYGQRYRTSRGDFYTSLVIEAWNTGRITNHNAAEFMGIKKLSHLQDIRANFG